MDGDQISGVFDLGKDFGSVSDLGSDCGEHLGFDLGTDLGTDLGFDLGSDLGSDLGTDLGTDLGFNTLGSSFEGIISWHKFTPSRVWYCMYLVFGYHVNVFLARAHDLKLKTTSLCRREF